MITLLFWISAGLVFYVYVGYPLLLWVFGTFARTAYAADSATPSVTLLIAAHNEAAVITNKIRNALLLDYPADKLEIVIASDGSTDATASRVRGSMEGEGKGRVRLFEFQENRGKIGALNEAISKLTTDVIAFSDASTLLATDSLRQLARHFGDPGIGAASGVYRLLRKDAARLGAQEGFYWKYETFLKVQEAKLGGYTGAHGSLYAVRRRLYPFPPADTINDDFVIPMRIYQQGFGVAYEPAAVAFEEAIEMEGFSRRVRITAGNFSQLRETLKLVWPPRIIGLWCLLSHKAGRLLVPVAMVTLALTSISLWRQPFYGLMLAAQAAFYGLALGAALRTVPPLLRLPYYFCMINSALFAWLYHAVRLGRLVPSRVQLDKVGGPAA